MSSYQKPGQAAIPAGLLKTLDNSRITLGALRQLVAKPVGTTLAIRSGAYLFRAKNMIVPRKPGRPDPLGPKCGLSIQVLLNDPAEAHRWILQVQRIVDR